MRALHKDAIRRRFDVERDMIRERVNVGIARARAQGKHSGRPRLKPELA
jgi:DNA invertase Pin-like site-specific DNA recombinase